MVEHFLRTPTIILQSILFFNRKIVLKVLNININGSWERNPNHISKNTVNIIMRERTNNMHSEREGMPKMSEKVGHTVSFSIDGEVDAALLYSTALISARVIVHSTKFAAKEP